MTDPIAAASEPRPQSISPILTGALVAVGLLAALYAAFTLPDSAFALQGKIFTVAALALSVVWIFAVTPRSFTAGFLGGLLLMLIGWRIAGLSGVPIVSYWLLIPFLAFVGQFFDAMRADLARSTAALMRWPQWHLTFLRIYIGFDMVPHFTEKLFAGSGPRLDDVKAFAAFGLPMPEAFVILGGLCELGIAIGIGMGLLTRLAGFGAALYFLIATVIGGHFFNGFIWAQPNGGWEYPVLMMVLYLSFVPMGAGRFSLDHVLIEAKLMPTALRFCATRG